MKKLLIATTNPGKVKELSEFLSDLPVTLVSLKDLKIADDVEETENTYKENSQLKALFYAGRSGLPAIADDGGLEIVALNNQPGVKSNRWLGPGKTHDDLIKHMEKVARELPDNNRTAYFKTVVSFALPNGRVWSVAGQVKGEIARRPGHNYLKGYPYRSFFYLPRLKKFYHEKDLSPAEQKLYNHRYKAIQKLKPIIKKCLT